MAQEHETQATAGAEVGLSDSSDLLCAYCKAGVNKDDGGLWNLGGMRFWAPEALYHANCATQVLADVLVLLRRCEVFIRAIDPVNGRHLLSDTAKYLGT